MMAVSPEHPKWDQNLKFTPLSKTMSTSTLSYAKSPILQVIPLEAFAVFSAFQLFLLIHHNVIKSGHFRLKVYFVLHSSVHSMEWQFLSCPELFSQWNTFQFTSWWSKTYSAVKGDNITSSTEKDLAPSRLIFLEGVSRFIPSFLIS